MNWIYIHRILSIVIIVIAICGCDAVFYGDILSFIAPIVLIIPLLLSSKKLYVRLLPFIGLALISAILRNIYVAILMACLAFLYIDNYFLYFSLLTGVLSMIPIVYGISFLTAFTITIILFIALYRIHFRNDVLDIGIAVALGIIAIAITLSISKILGLSIPVILLCISGAITMTFLELVYRKLIKVHQSILEVLSSLKHLE